VGEVMSFENDPLRWNSGVTDAPASLTRALVAAKKYAPGPADLAHMQSALQLGVRLSNSVEGSGIDPSTVAPTQAAIASSGAVGRLAMNVGKGAAAVAAALALLWGADRLLAGRWGLQHSIATNRTDFNFVPQASPADTSRGEVMMQPVPPSLGSVRRPMEVTDDHPSAQEVMLPRAKFSPRVAPARSHADKFSSRPAAIDAQPVPQADKASSRPAAIDPQPAPQAEEALSVVEAALVAPPPAPVPQIIEPAEAALLLAARRTLASDPAATLSTVRQHERRFPMGKLVEEREILAIEALRRLGRSSEAEARIERFRARYPSSIHLRSVKALASGQSSPNGAASSPR
jgi:hypothetical protein